MKDEDNVLLKLQDCLYNMLVEFDKICEEHNLTYYLSSGTLLGAVRHQGFIPWDDDIDVAMPREDYDKLINNFNEIMPNKYHLEYYKNTPGYYYTFIKIINTSTTAVRKKNDGDFIISGVYLDIFPIDGISNSYRKACFRRRKIQVYQLLIQSAAGGIRKKEGSLLRRTIVLLGKFLNADKLQEKLSSYLRKRPYHNYKYVMLYSITSRPTYVWKTSDIFKEPIKLKFRDYYFSAPTLPEKYLITGYGEDYMQLPPEEKRRQHDFIYVNLNLPFKEFELENIKELGLVQEK